LHSFWTLPPLFILLREPSKALAFLEVLGFTGETAVKNFEVLRAVTFGGQPSTMAAIPVSQLRIFTVLAIPLDAGNETEMSESLPTMAEMKELAKIERTSQFTYWCLADIVTYGAMAYLKCGRTDDAYEAASIGVSAEHDMQKLFLAATCHGILGQVAAKRGHIDEADGHFTNALMQAKLSGLPLFEIFAARDLKEHLLTPHGRDVGPAEAAIDAACAKMKKPRSDFDFLM